MTEAPPAGRHKRLGTAGERRAASYLEARGLEILERNWRHGRYEIDLVALDGEVVAFIEVKTRNPGVENGLESVAPAQRGRIRRAAEAWIHAHPGVGREFRFDVLTIDLDGRGEGRITHVPEAFYGDDGR